MNKIFQAFRQGFEALLTLRMVLLAAVPPFLAVLLIVVLFVMFWHGWSSGVAQWLQSLGPIHWVESVTGAHDVASAFAVIFLILLFVPVAYLAAVIFTSLFVMPFVLRWVVELDFKGLERKRGGSLWGGVLNTLVATMLFVVAFFVTLPLWFLPGFQVLVPLLLTSWLNKKIFLYDVLQDFASPEERRDIEQEESYQLYGMGLLLGLISYIPFAILVIPVLSGLCYTYYALNDLARRRAESSQGPL